MEEKLSKLELAVQYLHKEIKRVEKFQPEGADKTRLAPKETEIIVSVEEGPYLHQETYEVGTRALGSWEKKSQKQEKEQSKKGGGGERELCGN